MIFDNYLKRCFSVRFELVEKMGNTPNIAHRCFLLWRKPPPEFQAEAYFILKA